MSERMSASPVPTYSTFGSDGATASAPTDAMGWSSEIGAHVWPAFSDFQTPPAAVRAGEPPPHRGICGRRHGLGGTAEGSERREDRDEREEGEMCVPHGSEYTDALPTLTAVMERRKLALVTIRSVPALAFLALCASVSALGAQGGGGGRGGAGAAGGSGAAQRDTTHGFAINDENVVAQCKKCHARDSTGIMTRISYLRKTPEGWETSIRRMVTLNSVKLEPAVARAILRYLSNQQGLAPAEVRPGRFEAERRMIEYRYTADVQ